MDVEIFISTWGNVCIWLCILFQESEIVFYCEALLGASILSS